MEAFQQRFHGAASQGFEANPPLVIPDAHFPIVFSSLMFIFKKIGFLGKHWVYSPTFAGMVLKSLLGTATLSESMHKGNGSFSPKISWGCQSRVWSQSTISKTLMFISYCSSLIIILWIGSKALTGIPMKSLLKSFHFP